MAAVTKRHRCRHRFCPNSYDDLLGGDGTFSNKGAGGECMPCYYAGLFIHNGQNPEELKQHEQLMGMFLPHLEKIGWTWQDVEQSFDRMQKIGYQPE